MYRNLTEDAALAIATTIKYATYDMDRSRMYKLSQKYGGIRNITRFLMVAGMMTKNQRRDAIGMMPNVNNPSLKY